MRTQKGTDFVSLLYAKTNIDAKVNWCTVFRKSRRSFQDGHSRITYLRHENNINFWTVNIEYKKSRSATNILGDFCYVQFCYCTFGCTNKSQNRKWHRRNSAGAVIKLPRHVYWPNSEASVSNDGKIPGFRKFLFLSSVIKFDNKRA